MTSWPLNVSNFTWKDRLKICSFFLNRDKFWTMSDEVVKYEQEMAKFVGVRHAVFVSSGSTANTILAMYLKDQLEGTEKKLIVLPSTTWITSVSPFIREGFQPHFIDVCLTDLSLDLDKLEKFLKVNSKQVACVFITSLLGFSPDLLRLRRIGKKYGVKIMLDNCESTLTSYASKNISSYFTSTTSTYFGHLLQSVEGGFIFTNSDYEYEYFLMARNHGMTRVLTSNKEHYSNPDVDSRFDFRLLGNNFRNTNINAFIGLLDLKRAQQYIDTRKELYEFFIAQVKDYNSSIHIIERYPGDVPFSIPLIFSTPSVKKYVEHWCQHENIETRPIISGNLLRQTCLKKYGNPEDFPNSELLHANGLYVGLHPKVTKYDITKLVDNL